MRLNLPADVHYKGQNQLLQVKLRLKNVKIRYSDFSNQKTCIC